MNFDKTKINSDEAFEKLANKRLILRKMTQYKIPNSLRLTIGNKEANEHFIKSIREYFKIMFKKVCIIGCGLIGSSLARAIKKNNLAEKIVSSNRSDAINKKVIELKIVDDSSSDTKKMVEGSDLIIIATPLK